MADNRIWPCLDEFVAVLHLYKCTPVFSDIEPRQDRKDQPGLRDGESSINRRNRRREYSSRQKFCSKTVRKQSHQPDHTMYTAILDIPSERDRAVSFRLKPVRIQMPNITTHDIPMI